MFTTRALGRALCLLAFPLQGIALLLASSAADLPGLLYWLCGPVVLAAGFMLLRHEVPAATLEQELALASLRFGASVTLLDETGFVYSNKAALQNLGFDSMDELRGRSPIDLSPEFQPDGKASRDSAAASIEQATKQGRTTFKWLHHRKDGSAFPVEVTLISVLIGGKPHLINYWHDLTQVYQMRAERKQTLADLASRMDSTVRQVAQNSRRRRDSPGRGGANRDRGVWRFPAGGGRRAVGVGSREQRHARDRQRQREPGGLDQ